MTKNLGLELSGDYEAVRACVEGDMQHVALSHAIPYCDNIFKVHCPGLDLLTEIGEAQVQRCEQRLGESLGLELPRLEEWRTCARHEVFDRYVLSGESSDAAACKAVLVDECGASLR